MIFVCVYYVNRDSQSLQDDNEREVNQYLYSTEYLSDLENLSQQILKKGDKSFKRRLHEALIECVHLHQFILKACDTLEELFNPFCLIKSLQVTFQLCLLVFVGVEVRNCLNQSPLALNQFN